MVILNENEASYRCQAFRVSTKKRFEHLFCSSSTASERAYLLVTRVSYHKSGNEVLDLLACIGLNVKPKQSELKTWICENNITFGHLGRHPWNWCTQFVLPFQALPHRVPAVSDHQANARAYRSHATQRSYALLVVVAISHTRRDTQSWSGLVRSPTQYTILPRPHL